MDQSSSEERITTVGFKIETLLVSNIVIQTHLNCGIAVQSFGRESIHHKAYVDSQFLNVNVVALTL